jgi:hypothetical protein
VLKVQEEQDRSYSRWYQHGPEAHVTGNAKTSHRGRGRSGRTLVGVIGFFVLFTILLLMVYKFYTIPWIAEAKHASKSHLRKMSAEALLLMCVLLAILFSGLLVTFRISRFFVSPPGGKRSQTKVVDAWSEAGRRMEDRPTEDDESDLPR